LICYFNILSPFFTSLKGNSGITYILNYYFNYSFNCSFFSYFLISLLFPDFGDISVFREALT